MLLLDLTNTCERDQGYMRYDPTGVGDIDSYRLTPPIVTPVTGRGHPSYTLIVVNSEFVLMILYICVK